MSNRDLSEMKKTWTILSQTSCLRAGRRYGQSDCSVITRREGDNDIRRTEFVTRSFILSECLWKVIRKKWEQIFVKFSEDKQIRQGLETMISVSQNFGLGRGLDHEVWPR